jgi:two-component system, NtrC family, sensor kinase
VNAHSFFVERRRVLVIEDDRDFADSLVELLEPLGFTVGTAHNAAEALIQLAESSADLALIDVKLGTDSGIALVPLLKARKPNLICILMSAYAEFDAAVSAVRSGAHDYLLKPLEPTSLPDQLKRALDESDMRLRKEREQRLLLVGSVCTNVAHDVNNCLQLAYYDMDAIESAFRSSPPDTALAQSGLQSMAEALARATDICKQILQFSKGSPSEQHADAALVVRNCEPLLTRLIRSDLEVELEVLTPPGPLWVALGATQLEQVVTNLVINAWHATSQSGKVRVELTTHKDGASDLVRLRVTDNGCGIPKDILPRIFDPYFSTKPSHHGTGLGLSIVYGIVKAIAGGDLQVQSEPGIGSCFTVVLPNLSEVPAARRARS